jgi:hypothetical protein
MNTAQKLAKASRKPKNTTAVPDMLTGSVSQARNPRASRGGMRLSDGVKYPVTIRKIS